MMRVEGASMNNKLHKNSTARRLLLAALLPVALAMLCVEPAASATYTVHSGDTLWSVARKHHVSPEMLATQNSLKAQAPLRVGSSLKIPGSPQTGKPQTLKPDTKIQPGPVAKAPAAKPGAKTRRKAKVSKKSRLIARPAPVLDNRALLTKPFKPGPKGLDASPAAPDAERPDKFSVSPVTRPAMELLTPQDTIARAPKASGPMAPGLKATLRTSKDTGISGVFNAPGSWQGPAKSIPMMETDTAIGTSAGVMLEKSF